MPHDEQTVPQAAPTEALPAPALQPAASAARDSRETVILVHGTFAAPDPADAENRRIQWFEEEHAFVTALDRELASLNSPAACWKHRRDSAAPEQSFAWSGENAWFARREAADSLRDYLSALARQGWTTHIVAHSHGGNVAMEALNFFEGGIPTWFKGKIVLFGTPLLEPRVKLLDTGLLYPLTRFVGIGGLWFAAIGIALLWDRSWWKQSDFFAVGNLAALVAVLVFILIAFFGHGLWELLKRTAFNRDANEGADPVREHVLMIGSQWDEAFQLLHKAKVEPNPLLPKDAAASKPESRRKRGQLAIANQTALKAVRDTDRIYFQVERRDAYWLALAFNLAIALCAIAALAGRVAPAHRWIAADVVIIAAIASFAINRSYLGAWIAATGLPLRVCFWVGGYCWRMLRAVAMRLADGWLRSMAWSTLRDFAFGLGGSPFRLRDVEVHKSLRKDDWDTSFQYLELPQHVVARVMQARADGFRATSVSALERSLDADPNVGLIHPGLSEIARQPLVHNCYYSEPLCIRKAAQWIAAPLRRHPVEVAFDMATMRPIRFSYREESPDPRFDDPEKAWTL